MFRDQSAESETIDSEQSYGEKDYYSYIPIYAVPNAVTRALVGHSPVPSGYQADKDIGEKAVKDDWQEYLASQDKLRKLVILLLIPFILLPLLGLMWACCCILYKRRRTRCSLPRYCFNVFLALTGVLMLLSLLLAILATVQLNRSLNKPTDTYSQYLSAKSNAYYKSNGEYEYDRRLNDIYYNQFLKRTKSQSDVTRAVAHVEAIKNLNRMLMKMQGAMPLLEDLRNELTLAKGLANKFREALRAVKQNLEIFLTVQCKQKECRDFYTDNEIRRLDEGCLHYDRLPPTEEFTKVVEEILASNFVNYPLLPAQRIARAAEKPRKDSNPASALRGKLGPTWYKSTLEWLLFLLLLPLLLLIGLLVTLFSCKHGRRMLCAFLIAGIILLLLSLILTVFFLVHGALAHQIFCAEKGSKKSNDYMGYLPGDALQQSVSNESLYRDLVRESLEKLEGAPISGSHPQAKTIDRKLLGGNLLSNNSSLFTWHMCQELVPGPKPGPLPGLISRLDNLAKNVGSSPYLLNQTNYLGVAHRELGQPLAAIIQRLQDKPRQLDHLLSGGYGKLAGHMRRLLEKIKQSDPRHDAKKVTNEVVGNNSYFADSDQNNGTKYVMESRTPKPSLKVDTDREAEFNDLCKRIANPMNALWFWLLVFTLLLIPALCCAKHLRCRLCWRRCVSEETLQCCCEENHCALPKELQSHCRGYRYLPVCEETCCDCLAARTAEEEHHC